MPNCTCYAYGRAWELLGSKPKVSTGNAGQWYNYNKNHGYYTYGSTPKLGAIACWDRYDSNKGHVAVVEQINSNGTILISESHYKGVNFQTRTINSNSSNYLTSYRFLGYIYILEGNVDPVVPTTFQKDSKYPTPINTYPKATSGVLTVYDGNLSAYSTSTRNIAYNDLCTINAVYTNGYCNVTYPTSNGGKNTAYAKWSDFADGSVTPYSWSPSSNTNAYTRSNMSEVFGSVFSTDSCTVVGKSGDNLQVIYPITGGYKMGWVKSTSTQVKPDTPREEGILYRR